MIWMKMKMKNKIICILTLIILGCSSYEKRENTNDNLERPEYVILKGINLKQRGEYSEALVTFEELFKEDSKNKILLEEIAESYVKLGDYKKAIFYYEEAMKYSERDVRLIKNLAYTYYLDGNYKKSLESLENLYEKENDIETKKLKVFLLIKNNLKISQEYLENVENKIENFDINFYDMYVNFLIDSGLDDRVKNMLNSFPTRFYLDSEAMNFYFQLKYKYSFDYEELEKELKKYIVLNNNIEIKDEIYILLGEVEYKLKNYKESKNTLKFVSKNGRKNQRYLELVRSLDNENKL
ncbi:tetratricopeptide repeat protein [Fusobacterium sp. FSA-380-WT-3A]|nr:tetratricopeptide repeat protein [Fusobacterium perfoetens]NME36104.1 tetratricopeptide repeat protein [Fusobacterium sp. FSA-380-WT-3A]